MQTRRRHLGEAVRSAAAGGTTVAIAACALLSLVRTPDRTLDLGDIVAFAPLASGPAGPGTRLLVHRDNGFGCVLDLAVLRQLGGSLVVERRPASGRGDYHLHWAGVRTSGDGANCGDEAMLIVDESDVRTLVTAAEPPPAPSVFDVPR